MRTNQAKIKALASELSKDLKTSEDRSGNGNGVRPAIITLLSFVFRDCEFKSVKR